MRYLELRRHTMRVKPGQHLSQAGVTLARRLGETMGLFNRVVTSTIPRAYETAIAMGFAVDDQLGALSLVPDEVDATIQWDAGFLAWAKAAREIDVVGRYIAEQTALMYEIARNLPNEGAALIVSHGGIVEAQTVGCLPDVDFATWGEAIDYCEGVRLTFHGERFVSGQVLRIQKDVR